MQLLATLLAFSVVTAPSAPAIQANIAAARTAPIAPLHVAAAPAVDESFPVERADAELLQDLELSFLAPLGPISIARSSNSFVNVSVAAQDLGQERIHLVRHVYAPSGQTWARTARLDLGLLPDAQGFKAEAALRFEDAQDSPAPEALRGWTLGETVQAKLGSGVAERKLTLIDPSGRVVARSAGERTWGEFFRTLGQEDDSADVDNGAAFQGFWDCFKACLADMGVIIADLTLECLLDGFLACFPNPACMGSVLLDCAVELGAEVIGAMIGCAIGCL